MDLSLAAPKAQRAVLAAQRLHEIGIASPEPVGVVQIRSMDRLRRSFLLTRYWPHDWSLRDLFAQPESVGNHIAAVAQLLARVHQHGLVHRDNTAGNTIIRLHENQPNEYAIIDINRLRQARLTDLQACWNIAQIGFRESQLRWLLQHYRPQADQRWLDWAYQQTIKRHDDL